MSTPMIDIAMSTPMIDIAMDMAIA